MSTNQYLSNKELLEEIHISKNSYCEYKTPAKHKDYDIIVDSVDDIFKKSIQQQAKKNRMERIANKQYQSAMVEYEEDGGTKPKLNQFKKSVDTPEVDDLVYRVYTYDHIPLDPERKRNPRTVSEEYVKINFVPFKHYIIKNDKAVEVGRSHSKNGEFCQTHGALTEKLAGMFLLLVNRYSQRANWRGYCVDDQTQALTQRGWLNGDQIKKSDMVLSRNSDGVLTWSPIHHLYRDHYTGLMHHVSNKQGLNMLVTPEHKLVTRDGLRPMELIRESDHVVLMGSAESGANSQRYSDSMVELAGWIVTEGYYERDNNNSIKSICIWQNPGKNADRIRNNLQELNFEFSEEERKGTICFSIFKKHCQEFVEILPEKNINMDFLLSLTKPQRQLLFDTMIAGDGWKRGKQSSYAQKCPEGVDMFQALATLLGRRSTAHPSTQCHTINVFSERKNNTNGSCLDFNGGKRTKGKKLGKENHPNVPTVPYDGNVWCVHTDHGSFVVRRNGNTHLTGNSYVDEMIGQSLLQLSEMSLKFDESKSDNPFAYYTRIIQNSFTRVLNTEKKNQRAKDEILIDRGQLPSFSRQMEHEEELKNSNQDS